MSRKASHVRLTTAALVATVSTVACSNAFAVLQLTTAGPDTTGIDNPYKIEKNGNVTETQIVTALNTISPGLGLTLATLPPELYKSDPKVADVGILAGTYNTAWSPISSADKESASITAVVGKNPFDTTQLTWLLAKDGVSHYVWNLTGIWDGVEEIQINNLWPDQGSFSHISIGGARSTSVVVPEPSTYIAGGLALVPLLLGLRSLRAKKS
jgi:hypothetical protein